MCYVCISQSDLTQDVSDMPSTQQYNARQLNKVQHLLMMLVILTPSSSRHTTKTPITLQPMESFEVIRSNLDVFTELLGPKTRTLLCHVVQDQMIIRDQFSFLLLW